MCALRWNGPAIIESRTGTSVEFVVTTSELEYQTRDDSRLFADSRRSRPDGALDMAELIAARTLLHASRWGALPQMVQRTFLVRALARAIAHELGHYLLESRTHSAHGLMRGHLTAEDIMQPLHSSDRLEPAQIERLRRGVLFAQTSATSDTLDTKDRQSPKQP